MKGKRHETIGIKQAIRFEWMQKAANLLLVGLDAKTIRQELHEFLTDRKGNGFEGERSEKTRTFAVNNLMKIWISPAPELVPFRDASLAYLRENPPMALAVHWAMASAAYPFWFDVAKQTGRLLALQEQVTQSQIVNRIKEQYGDRQTVSRYARYVLRSFVSWGVLKDGTANISYEKQGYAIIGDHEMLSLLLESALHATTSGKMALAEFAYHPALFPFRMRHFSGDILMRHVGRVTTMKSGMVDEIAILAAKAG